MNNISQILTNNINIREITYDFNNYKIKHNTFFKNKEHEMKIRYENLHDIINILNKHNIEYWLQGKTMLGISKYGQLIKNDSDEDIGLDSKNILSICNIIIPELTKIGFKVIRATKNNSMVSIMRNNRYLDFCFFQTNNDIYFYEKKQFPKNFYDNIININVNDFKYCVPEKYKEICKYSYNI
tara:strand:- start:123 stop:671 length:549 start_codon:yes stop_codon:yes gene_type:complete